MTIRTIAEAIRKSHENGDVIRVAYAGDTDAAIAALIADADQLGYDTDYAVLGEACIDAWGWTAETADDTQDWRIRIIPIPMVWISVSTPTVFREAMVPQLDRDRERDDWTAIERMQALAARHGTSVEWTDYRRG